MRLLLLTFRHFCVPRCLSISGPATFPLCVSQSDTFHVGRFFKLGRHPACPPVIMVNTALCSLAELCAEYFLANVVRFMLLRPVQFFCLALLLAPMAYLFYTA